MSDVPERWTSMAAEAILGEEATATYGYEGASWRIDSEHVNDIAEAALAPVIADLRRMVDDMIDLATRDEEGTRRALSDDYWSGKRVGLKQVLDLMDTGGSDG